MPLPRSRSFALGVLPGITFVVSESRSVGVLPFQAARARSPAPPAARKHQIAAGNPQIAVLTICESKEVDLQSHFRRRSSIDGRLFHVALDWKRDKVSRRQICAKIGATCDLFNFRPSLIWKKSPEGDLCRLEFSITRSILYGLCPCLMLQVVFDRIKEGFDRFHTMHHLDGLFGNGRRTRELSQDLIEIHRSFFFFFLTRSICKRSLNPHSTLLRRD
ncbi:hypothetical protein KSP40_PGU006839 [Platanthera guangdongensis]|uniref:Uncharacterized protein n=1 Tax=Platanthera guangdongensis TaxID=2320717 RepID=A0ABR2MJ19_9ASPA